MHSEFDELLASMKQFIADSSDSDLSLGYQNALATALACRAHRKGDHADVLEYLLPMQSTLASMGGSHAQQEVFFQMMYDSAHHLKRDQDMQQLARALELQGFQSLNQRAAYKPVASSLA